VVVPGLEELDGVVQFAGKVAPVVAFRAGGGLTLGVMDTHLGSMVVEVPSAAK